LKAVDPNILKDLSRKAHDGVLSQPEINLCLSLLIDMRLREAFVGDGVVVESQDEISTRKVVE
jgi:hypothetical protein